jgi:hypothetical protein
MHRKTTNPILVTKGLFQGLVIVKNNGCILVIVK